MFRRRGCVNFMMDENVGRVRATCPGNYERLAAVEAKHDPGSLFRVNWDIIPRD